MKTQSFLGCLSLLPIVFVAMVAQPGATELYNFKIRRKFLIICLSTLNLFNTPAHTFAMTLDQCISQEGDYLINICVNTIGVYFENCNGTTGLFYAKSGKHYHPMNCRFVKIKTCNAEDIPTHKCEFRG